MRKRINLFLDDDPTRIPTRLTWIELPLVEWTIVRTYDDFVRAIEQNDINMVSFDHDIDDMAYREFFRANAADKVINYDNIKEKTGYHCAQVLANYCIDHNIPIPPYFVHSLNYIGKQNIISVLESAKKALTNS
jgi:hypothetical protein